MGGSIAITIREESGKEHRMNRWTNGLPFFLTNIDFCQNDPSHLKSYLDTWYDFVDDWKVNGPNYLKNGKANFRHDMTPVYAHHPYLAPNSYGQVVVDFVNKKILHAQGYTSIGEIYRINAVNDLDQEGKESYWYDDPEDGANTACRLRKFFEAGRIKEIFSLDESKLLTKIEDIKDSKELLVYLTASHVKKNKKLPDYHANFLIDMSPFEVIQFEESEQGFLDLKQAVLDLGFVLSDTENELWDRYISVRFKK